MEEKLAHAVVSHENVREAVVVEIGKSKAEPFAARVCDACFVTHIFETAVCALVKEDRGGALEIVGVAISSDGRTTGKRAMLEIPLNVAQDKQIEPAIPIIVEPTGACGPTTTTDARFFGDVFKRPVTTVAIEYSAAKGSDVEVDKSVVIEVTRGHAHRIAFAPNAGAFRNIFEAAIRFLMIETIPKTRVTFVRLRLWGHRIT